MSNSVQLNFQPMMEEEINPGRFGKRLAEFIALGLKVEGETINELIPEDWRWLIPIDNPTFTLWVGVGNHEEYENGFLCFIEPHQEYVCKLWKKFLRESESRAYSNAYIGYFPPHLKFRI